MNNEELKKKICEIIAPYVAAYGEDDAIADALIAAGIVADVQSLADGNCVLYVKGKGFMRLYNEQDINEMIHRAEVAERALELMARGECTFASPEYYKEQAEKELQEEKKYE